MLVDLQKRLTRARSGAKLLFQVLWFATADWQEATRPGQGERQHAGGVIWEGGGNDGEIGTLYKTECVSARTWPKWILDFKPWGIHKKQSKLERKDIQWHVLWDSLGLVLVRIAQMSLVALCLDCTHLIWSGIGWIDLNALYSSGYGFSENSLV